ncbi:MULTISPECIES: peptidase inhibitor family I36 protein [Kitasatospora]|uniref:peptidase inhibitor family I36 protein n=1 Tax=Kitasatospora TaxID=2063 RepID=UPI000C70EDB8|nr:peptidase inhibitor family I36 protein [Kitasatospora sp. GP30]MDH6142981.1 hypothetical protein [Kitasatospora sp. GP30]
MNLRKKIAAAAVSVVALGAVAIGASPASASPGGCVSGTDACLFYHSNLAGAFNGDGGNDNYGAAWYFEGCSNGNCDGQGQQVKNNTASVYNETGRTLVIYVNSNWSGPSQAIGAWTATNLDSELYNNNASQHFF